MTEAKPAGPRPVHRRHIFYVDQKIQAFMLGLLVVLEVCLVGGALWYLFGELNATIDAQLFRVHQPKVSDTTPVLLSQLWRGILWLIGINLLALIVADRAWAYYVDTITRLFRDTMIKIIGLDFSPIKVPTTWHRVLHLSVTWRDRERERCHELRAIAENVSKMVENDDLSGASEALAALRVRTAGAVTDRSINTPQ